MTGRVYLVLGAGPTTLVDTGSRREKSIRQIHQGLDAVRTEFGEPVRLADVQRILLTHGHVDHVGGLRALWPECHAEVAIHELDSRALTAGPERAVLGRRKLKMFLAFAGVATDRWAELIGTYGFAQEPPPEIPLGRRLTDGQQLDGFRVIHTPGHSPGHACFAVDDVLLAGDQVLSRTLSQQWPEAFMPYLGLGHYLESLDRLEASGEYTVVLPGHEAPIDDWCGRIDEIRRTHRRRNERLLGLLADADEPMTIDQLARQMYAQAQGFHVVLALNDAASRAEYLHQRGLVRVMNLEELDEEATAPFRYAAGA